MAENEKKLLELPTQTVEVYHEDGKEKGEDPIFVYDITIRKLQSGVVVKDFNINYTMMVKKEEEKSNG